MKDWCFWEQLNFTGNKGTQTGFYLSNMLKDSLLQVKCANPYFILAGIIFSPPHQLQTSLVVPDAVGHGI